MTDKKQDPAVLAALEANKAILAAWREIVKACQETEKKILDAYYRGKF